MVNFISSIGAVVINFIRTLGVPLLCYGEH